MKLLADMSSGKILLLVNVVIYLFIINLIAKDSKFPCSHVDLGLKSSKIAYAIHLTEGINMFTLALSRSALVLFLAALMTACGSPLSRLESTAQNRVDECTGNRSRCMYEGSYDKDEKEYARQEAARLNRAQSLRMGRRSWW